MLCFVAPALVFFDAIELLAELSVELRATVELGWYYHDAQSGAVIWKTQVLALALAATPNCELEIKWCRVCGL